MKLDKNWIKLTKDNIEDALKKASISFSPKNNLEGLAKHEKDQWWWDLDMLVGKTQGFNMFMTIEQNWNKKEQEYFIVTFHPWECRPHKELPVLAKRPTDKEVIEIFNKYASEWLSLIAKKGLHKEYFYSGDGDQWDEWRFGKNKNIFFLAPRVVRGLGLEKRFGWKILQNPLSNERSDVIKAKMGEPVVS